MFVCEVSENTHDQANMQNLKVLHKKFDIDVALVFSMHMSYAKVGGKMAIFGYARVSTDGQSLASQDAQLRAAGCAKVYAEKVSGAKTDRTELAKVLRRLESGDVLMVHPPRPAGKVDAGFVEHPRHNR